MRPTAIANVLLSTLALAHLASALTIDQSVVQKPLTDAQSSVSTASQTHVTQTQLDDLTTLAALTDIAYCVPNPGISKPFKCASRCAAFPDIELLKPWSSGLLLMDSSGYVALDADNKRIIVAFRGTYSLGDVLVDLSTKSQSYVPYIRASEPSECDNCLVHAGFLSSWLDSAPTVNEAVEEQLRKHPDFKLEVLGHSLGGAIALIAGLDFAARGWSNLRITTFGQPKLGNRQLISYIDRELVESGRLRRVTRKGDPVPLLPLTEWDYYPHAGELFINKDSLELQPEDVLVCSGDADLRCSAAMDYSLFPHSQSPSVLNTLKNPAANLSSIPNLPLPESDGTEEGDRPVADAELESRFTTELFDEKNGVQDRSLIPLRFRLWHLFFAHRDYFVRLGLCVGPTFGLPGLPDLGDGSFWDHFKNAVGLRSEFL